MNSNGLGRWLRLPCLVVALYFTGALAYALWNFESYGSREPQFIRYIALPAALALFFLLCAVLLPRRIAVHVNASLAAIVVAVFAAQLVISASSFMATLNLLEAGTHAGETVSADGMPPDLALDRMNERAGVQALDQALLGGIPGVSVLMCFAGNEPVRYAADRYGFNNPDKVHESPVDVAIVGDSFVEGACLQPGADFVSRVRENHPATASLGMRGNGPLYELAVIGRFGPVLRPKTVLLAFFEGNDMKDLSGELRTPWLRTSLESNARFGHEPVPPRTLAAARAALEAYTEKRRTPLELLLRTHFLRNFLALEDIGTAIGIAYPKVTPVPEAYGNSLDRARAIAATWGGRLALIYIPQANRFVGLFPPAAAYDTLRLDVLKLASDRGMDVIDLTPHFEQHEEPLSLYAPDAHFSGEGADLAARVVSDYLAR